jgi:hypothetical protein
MRPSRRRVLLAAAGLALAASDAVAHTPYGQWVVYRQKHLLVGSHRGDGQTYALAKEVVSALGDELPEARARVARGPRPQRIASLMGTGQLLLAVLTAEEASRMASGRPPFEGYTPVPLQVVAALPGTYRLYATPGLPDDHALLVAQALAHGGTGRPPADPDLPVHSGVAGFWAEEAGAG